MQPVRIFFSYCHRDEDLRDEMVKHLSILKRQKVIEAWYDRDIDAGSKWEEEIYEQLSKAHIVLLLISPDFLNSEYCYENELKQAMERHEAGKALVIPIVLRSCDWRGAPFGKFQALPKDAKPVTSWPDRDAAFTNIAQGIRKAVSKIIPLNFANDSQDQKVSLTDGLISKSSNPDFLTSQRKTITESPDIFVNLRKAYAELTNAQNELERRALEIVESNDLLQQILSTMSDALFLTDHVGCVVRANRASSALLKCDESSILGQQLSEILSTKKIPSTPAKLMEFVRTKRGNNLEMDLHTRDGGLVSVSLSIDILQDNQGKTKGLLAVARDISDQKKAEARLQASEARFRALVENGFDGISLQDAEGRITYVSPAYERVLGYLPEEVLGQQPIAQVHPNDVDVAIRARTEVGQMPGASCSLQFRTLHKNGTWRWLEVTMTNLLDQADVASVVVNFRDITERQSSEKALRESEEKFRAIWDNALDGMLIINDDMQYVDANPAACKLYGVTREELLAQTMADFVRPDNQDAARRSLQKLVAQGERTGHFQLRRSDHTLREIEYNARANFLPGMHLSMMRDVTERHRAAESLRSSEEQYRSLVSVLEEGILMLDSEGELLTCNESAERIMGARRDILRERGLISSEWRAIREDGTPFPTEEAPSVVTLCTRKPCSGVVLGIVRPDGNSRWLSVSSQPVFHQDSDTLQAVVLSISDITQRKQAEAALRESEMRFSAAFDDGPLAVSLTEQATQCFINVNQAWCKLFGMTSVEAIGHTELELGLWETADDRNELFRQMALHGGAWEQEARLRTRAGRPLQALVSVRAMWLGQKQYVITLVHDITERKLAEERFAKAFNANPNPMSINTLPDGRLVQVNETWVKFTGYDFGAAQGRTTADLGMWLDPAHRVRFLGLLQAQGSVSEFETFLRRKDGSVHTILLSGEVIDLDGQPHMLSCVTDITERKKAEEAVRISQERFAKAFNACPEPMVLQRLEDDRYVSANRACLTALGLTEEELIGHTADDIGLWVNEAQRQTMQAALQKAGEVRDLECDYYVGNRRLGHFLVSAEIIEIEGVKHVLSVSRDITERKRGEEALRASEERFAKAFNSSPQPIAIASLPEGRFITANEAWSRVMGHRIEDTIGRDAAELNLWADRRQRRRFGVKLRRGEAIRDQELTLRAKNGELRYLIVYGEAIQLAGEDYLLLTALDVTERKLAERALRDTEERFRLLFQWNLAGVYRATVEGHYLECNDAYAAMFGFASPEELKATAAWCLYPDQQARNEMLAQVRAHGSLNNYEMQLQRKDGSAVWALTNITYHEAEGNTPAVIEGVALDITKRKLDEAKLAESREQLRALSARLAAIREEERTAIAREIHDSLGQLLTGLKLDVAWLHKRLTNNALADTREALVQKTEGMSSLLDDTIQTVRDLATQLSPGVLDTLGLTAAIEWQVQDFQARTGIECEIWLCPEPKDLPPEKATALFRILQEILTNIIRHAEASRVVLHLIPMAGALLLTVADNGRGITTSNLRDAKSLGLLGMRERALMVGGEVNFKGTPDRGTTVSVKIPI